MNWKTKGILLLALLMTAPSAHAITVQVPLTGSSVSVPLKGRSPGEMVTFWAVSSGNESIPLKVSMFGPPGSALSTSAAKIQGSVAQTLRSPNAFFPLTLRAPEQFNAFHAQCVEFAPYIPEGEFDPNDIKSTWDPFCESFTPGDMATIGASLTSLYGGSWDIGRVCGYLLYSYQGGAGEGEMQQQSTRILRVPRSVQQATVFGGLLQKDACGRPADKYVVRVRVKLPPTLPKSGFLRIRLTEGKYTGDKRATIKPVSEGKYAPDPLFLFSSISSCGQRMQVTKWAGGKPMVTQDVRLYDLITYRDMTLTRSPVGSYLTGGKASIELFNRNYGYAVCFNLTRTRQRANGYPS